jgi:hypothetical protein
MTAELDTIEGEGGWGRERDWDTSVDEQVKVGGTKEGIMGLI